MYILKNVIKFTDIDDKTKVKGHEITSNNRQIDTYLIINNSNNHVSTFATLLLTKVKYDTV